MGRTQTLGREAEDRAEALLSRAGLRTVARNYRCRVGEIDLVMRDDTHLVFVEVRYRSGAAFGGAAASVDTDKQRKLILAAQQYLLQSRWQGPCRFDVVTFDQDQGERWIRNAFGA